MSLNEGVSTAVVGTGDGAKSLLTGSVPDLQFANFTFYLDHFETKIYADCRQVVVDEVVVTETDEEG